MRPDEITSALLRISDISASYKISVCREHSFDMVDVFIKPDLDCDTFEAERVKEKVEKVKFVLKFRLRLISSSIS